MNPLTTSFFNTVRYQTLLEKSKTTISLLAAILLSNLLFHIAATWLGLSRPLLNIDYIFAATLFSFGHKRIGLILALLFSIFDAFQLVNQIYPFIRISDLAVLLQLLPKASSWHVMIFFSVTLIILGSAVLVFLFSRELNKTVSLLAMNALLLWLVAVRVTNPQEIHTAWRVERTGLVDSAALFFVEHRITGNAAQFFAKGNPFDSQIESASSILDTQQDKRHVLLIVAESWGLFRDDALKNTIINPIKQLTEQRQVKLSEGTVDFVGPTVAAEIRELCKVSLKHLNMLELKDDVDGCLPEKFNKKGYQSVAIHAAIGSIYWRRTWYPRIGFSEIRFKEDGRWQSECKSFPGSCDAELARTDIQSLLSQDAPTFIYWLTLNSHQPYREIDIRESYFDCSEMGINIGSEPCRMAQLHAQFFTDLADVLSKKEIRNVEVLVVGDHPPPLINTINAKTLIEYEKVPWLHFVLE